MTEISKRYTDKLLLDRVDFNINEGEKVGVIGINGTGKSTLLKIMAGLEEADHGTVKKGNHVHVRYLPQNPVFDKDLTIYDYVITKNKNNENEWLIEGEAKTILNKLGFKDYYEKMDYLSGGQRKRAALAAALINECEILILDEPTNHLDNRMTGWLEEYLVKRKGALVMVTHDRYFLDRVSNRIVEIDRGKVYSYQANYSEYLMLKAEREEMAASSERKRQSILRTELMWIQRGARARSTKQKARIERYEALKGRTAPAENSAVDMNTVSSRLGKKTIELTNVTKIYEKKVLIKDFSYIFLKNDRIGIIGENGCGKTTLLKIITENILPDSGDIEVGSTVKIGYFSQENEYMNDQDKVIDYIHSTAEYIRTNEGLISAGEMLKRFLFEGAAQYSLIGKLSGGEKRRLYLLKILISAPNVLILDEPTNDLDTQTLTILEDYLDQFDGIVITVSHDRYFLDRITDRIFSFEENGIIKQYEGGFSDYLERYTEEHPIPGTNNKKLKDQEERNTFEKNLFRTKSKLKFTYKEQIEYDCIEEEIMEIEEQLEKLNQAIEDASTDFLKLNQLTQEKQVIDEMLELKMERWLYLNKLNESINAQKK